MKIKDLTTGQIFEYGSNRHHALRISGDGRTLSFENLQNGDGSLFGDYRFIDDSEEVIPSESECSCKHGADSYFNIGGFTTDINTCGENMKNSDVSYKEGCARLIGEILAEKIESLSDIEQKVIKLKYGIEDGILRTDKEVAEECGIHKTTASLIKRQALRNLR